MSLTSRINALIPISFSYITALKRSISFFVQKLSVVDRGENNNIKVLSFVSRRRHLVWIATFRLHAACLLQATKYTFYESPNKGR